MRGAWWWLTLAGCYAPQVPAGVACDPAQPACPFGQFCASTGGGAHACSSDSDPDVPDASDAAGDAATVDTDGDGVPDELDNCPATANATQDNYDGDRFGDACDPCPPVADDAPADRDQDGVADACDPDPDTAGDAIVRFDTFRQGTSAWTVTGAWTIASDGVAIDATGGVATLAATAPSGTRASLVAAFTPTALDAATSYAGLGVTANALDCELMVMPSAQDKVALVNTTWETAVASDDHAVALGEIYIATVTQQAGNYRCRAAPSELTASGSNPAHGSLALRAHNARGVFHWAMVIAGVTPGGTLVRRGRTDDEAGASGRSGR